MTGHNDGGSIQMRTMLSSEDLLVAAYDQQGDVHMGRMAFDPQDHAQGHAEVEA